MSRRPHFNGFVLSDIIRTGSYGEDLDGFKRFVKAHIQPFDFNKEYLLEHVIASKHIDAMDYFMTEVVQPTFTHIHHALSTEDVGVVKAVCDHASREHLNIALIGAVVSASMKLINTLLEYGADPNFEDSAAMLNAAEHGRLNVLRFLHARGGILEPQLLSAACYWEHHTVAFWLYQKGVRSEYESPGFVEFLKQKQIVAQRKIYFWYMKNSLLRNKNFLLAQASKSYDALFGVSEC
jgi:hypothetical protein